MRILITSAFFFSSFLFFSSPLSPLSRTLFIRFCFFQAISIPLIFCLSFLYPSPGFTGRVARATDLDLSLLFSFTESVSAMSASASTCDRDLCVDVGREQKQKEKYTFHDSTRLKRSLLSLHHSLMFLFIYFLKSRTFLSAALLLERPLALSTAALGSIPMLCKCSFMFSVVNVPEVLWPWGMTGRFPATAFCLR